jgi:hypothetical protein
MGKSIVTRRDFIKATGLLASAGFLTACRPDPTEPTAVQKTATASQLPTQPPEPLLLDCWWNTDVPDLNAKLPDSGEDALWGGYARQLFPAWLAKHPGVALKITGHAWANQLPG